MIRDHSNRIRILSVFVEIAGIISAQNIYKLATKLSIGIRTNLVFFQQKYELSLLENNVTGSLASKSKSYIPNQNHVATTYTYYVHMYM